MKTDKNIIGLSVLYKKIFGIYIGALGATNFDALRKNYTQKDTQLNPNHAIDGKNGFDLSGFDTQVFNGVYLFSPIKIENYQLPNEPLISFNKKNKIVKTELTGSRRAGTVKEIIGQSDWNMSIKGIAINENNPILYPSQQVSEIRKLFDMVAIKGSLSFVNPIGELLGITQVVIEDISFKEIQGVQHAQAYTMKLTSDEDFVLTEF